MPFQHNRFGLTKNPLIDSPYVQNFELKGTPIPPPPHDQAILLEDGGYILLEDNGLILLETA